MSIESELVGGWSEKLRETDDRAGVPTISPSNESNLERAASYYRTAADTQLSAMAYWNLGYMHEHGKGVPRDWYLAKRYYDLSGEVSADGWGAVMLSLIGLYVRRCVRAGPSRQ